MSRQIHWLGDGPAGAALACIERAARTGDWTEAHQAVVKLAAVSADASSETMGLFRGASALAYVLHRADRPAYNSALAELDEAITAATHSRLKDAHRRIEAGELTSIREYDLISGLTGLGLYHLVRGHDDVTLDVLDYLVTLTEPVVADGWRLPGWWCPDGPDGRASAEYEGGHANFGMAHGIAGPLALLSAAMTLGTHVPGQSGAIERICAFLDAWQQRDETATWWPEIITRSELEQRRPERMTPQRPSWCYGVPGIARAQQLAGIATGDPARGQRAAVAMADVLGDPRQLDQLTDAGLCHGWAGLLHTARCIAADAPQPDAWTLMLRTAERHLEDHLSRFGPPLTGSLLTGPAGVELVEHTDVLAAQPDKGWDACLLLTFPTHNATRKP